MNTSCFFGNKLRELRILKNMTAGQLASHLKCSSSLIYNIEKGLNRPQPELIVLTAKFFGVTTDYLLMEESIENEDKIIELYQRLNSKGKLYLNYLMKILDNHD